MGANEARPGQAGGSNYVPSHMNFKKSQVSTLHTNINTTEQSSEALTIAFPNPEGVAKWFALWVYHEEARNAAKDDCMALWS